jgi:S-(hydroxymethyl)glutathione dehydrogenase/alcohol dehydrogenase
MEAHTLKAAVLFKLNTKLKIIDLKIPILKPYQVLVKIKYSSICRSQLMEIYSGRDNKKWLPHLLGHEGTGKIIKLGSKIKNYKIGDNVILTWLKTSSQNSVGPKYIYKKKIINAGKVTTFSNYAIVSIDRILKRPKNISPKLAALLGCCFLTGPGMIYNETHPKKESSVVLIGLGGVGLGALLALKEKKIKSVVIVEKDLKKIKYAKKLGFKKFVRGIKEKDKKKILKFLNGYADLCYESAGSIKTLNFGISVIKPNGHLHFASHPEQGKKFEIDPHDFIIGKTITGSWGGGCEPKRDVKKFSKLIIKNQNLLNKIFVKTYSLKNINKAIINFKNNKDFRPILDMEL